MTQNQHETEIHPVEKHRHEDIKETWESDDSVVTLERPLGDDLPVVAEDGQLVGIFKRAMKKIQSGESKLEGLLFPFTIKTNRLGDIEIRRKTEFYWKSEELTVQVTKATIDKTGRIFVELTDKDVSRRPLQKWEFRTIDLVRLIEERELQTKQEVHDQLMDALENYS